MDRMYFNALSMIVFWTTFHLDSTQGQTVSLHLSSPGNCDDDVTLVCQLSTPYISTTLHSWRGSKKTLVTNGNAINDKYAEEAGPTPNDFSLVIRNMSLSDAGYYSCHYGSASSAKKTLDFECKALSSGITMDGPEIHCLVRHVYPEAEIDVSRITASGNTKITERGRTYCSTEGDTGLFRCSWSLSMWDIDSQFFGNHTYNVTVTTGTTSTTKLIPLFYSGLYMPHKISTPSLPAVVGRNFTLIFNAYVIYPSDTLVRSLWLLNGEPVETSDKYNITAEETRSNFNTTLTIFNVTKEDAGDKFQCIGWVVEGAEENSEPFIMPEPLYGPENVRFDPVDVTQSVVEGSSETITCSADCNPECEYQWIKDGDPVSSSKGVIVLSNISRSIDGRYTCVAKNKDTSESVSITKTLIVLFAAHVISVSEDVLVDMNDDVLIVCKVEAEPRATVTWRRNGQYASFQTDSDHRSTLSLKAVQCDDIGLYTCHVENSLGIDSKTVEVMVKCPPEEIPNAPLRLLYEVAGGENVSLSMTVESFRVPHFQWRRGSSTGELLTNMQLDTSRTSTLTITNVRTEDFGNYTVTVSNGIPPNLLMTFQVLSGGPPTEIHDVPPRLLYKVPEGENVSLTMTVESFRVPHFQWRRGSSTGELLTDMQFDTTSTSTLTITSVRTEDFGNYTVTVSNGISPSLVMTFQVLPRDEPQTRSLRAYTLPEVIGAAIGALAGGLLLVSIVIILIKYRKVLSSCLPFRESKYADSTPQPEEHLYEVPDSQQAGVEMQPRPSEDITTNQNQRGDYENL